MSRKASKRDQRSRTSQASSSSAVPMLPPRGEGSRYGCGHSTPPPMISSTPAFLARRATGIRITDQDSVRITLTDVDLSENDQIAVFSISGSELRAAAATGSDVMLNVADRSEGQVLIAKFKVYPA